ncbi:imidazolonepropionase [Bacteriovorax sp. BSW11_IV]|uniref:imidazolonepropionase n=1 Tax=Bacteriovorax sp. BSW11_IV TaxID=1353529 RepID=UPI00038A077C|nr:imidazolonepropionase [Bacteriovorax sp. BSW11_IV]EQC50043.1 imidazolonepropionase [Bacteriovorax sp. BSW11_IV]
MKVLRNFNQIITLKKAHELDGRNLKNCDLSIIENGSVVFDEEKIIWVGADEELPENYKNIPYLNKKGHVLLPEIVDCHTHLVFGGNRAKEYSMRLNGADYQDIAKAGGGILYTMNKTNELTRSELFDLACERIERINSYGVGTIEIKSGYGLNFDKEYECSLIIDDLKQKYASLGIQIINTYMAAHAVPKSFASSSAYLDEVVIPLMKKLVDDGVGIDFVDIFHEAGYFDNKDTQKLFDMAQILGLKFKSHADEFIDNKGAVLAATSGASSTEHLLCTEKDGIEALAQSSTVATLLPGTGFFLGKPQAKARAFLDASVKVAIGSDYNPGSCHCDNVILVASLAAPHYKMTLTELWAAITLNAAHALDLREQGAIIPGLKPRFSCFAVDSVDEITYSWGRNFKASLL